MAEIENNDFTEEQQEVLKSIRLSRIIIPVLIGIGVVLYMMLKDFKVEDFKNIDWNNHLLFWIAASLFLLVIRHLAYATRLRILSDGEFGWLKCIQLIFIWEFSSAVSPTSVGGSAVALFVLSQEKLSTAKTSAIVIYTIVLDTFFFISSLTLLFMVFGYDMVRPGATSFSELDAWGKSAFIAYPAMFAYGFLFFYGLFFKPVGIKRLLVAFTKIKWLRKFRKRAVTLGDEIIIASKEIRTKNVLYHLGGFLTTAIAWSCRFLLLSCLLVGFVKSIGTDFWTQFAMYARLEVMYIVMAFSPTPGSAGVAELLFNGFISDYVDNKTVSNIIAFIWRLFTFYFYLIAGAIIIPVWIRGILNRRSKKKYEARKE